MRSAMEVLLTLNPSPPPSTPPALGARLARALLKAKKSPNFFLMFLVGSVEVVVVTVEGAVGGKYEERGGSSVHVKDVSVDGTEGEVRMVVVEEVILSDEEEKGVEVEGVDLDSEGVAWAGFESSHRPFLQQGDSRKSNRQEETLSTTTTTTRLKTHAHFRYTARKVMQTAQREKRLSVIAPFCFRGQASHKDVGQLVSLSSCLKLYLTLNT